MRLTILVLCGIVSRLAHAQWMPMQQSWGGGWGSAVGTNNVNSVWGQQQQQQRVQQDYLTCIGKTATGDEMRLTISRPTQNWWQTNSQNQNLQLEGSIRVSGQSQINAQYSLIITEYGRVEDGCYTASMGRVLDNFRNLNTWLQFPQMNQQRASPQPSGVIAGPYYLTPNNGQQLSGNLNGFNFNEIVGCGIALCQRVSNRMCVTPIMPMCCKIGHDSAQATQPVTGNQIGNAIVTSVVPSFGAAGGMNTGGMAGGMNTGMNTGMNPAGGMNTGLNTAGGVNTGLNTGGATPGGFSGGLFR